MRFALHATVVLLLCRNCFCQQVWSPANCADLCHCGVKEWAAPFPPFLATKMKTVDCSGKDLRSVPMLPNDTQVLLLDDNRFESLSSVVKALAAYENLQELSLSNNNITNTVIDVTLNSLRRIVLNDNNVVQLSASLFEYFPNVNELSIQRNKLKSIPSASAERRNSLYTLKLDSNQISNLTWMTELRDFGSLSVLSLAGNHLVCGSLPKSVFRAFPNMTALIIGDMNLEDIGKDAFAQLDMLQSLDLDNNKLRAVPTGALSETKNLRHFTMKRNCISDIRPYDFFNLTKLETIDLSNQRSLQFVDHDAFVSLPNLQTVLLANNARLSYVAGNSFHDCPNVETLDLQSTMIEIVESQIKHSLPALRKIYLKNNPIYCNCMMMWIKEWIPEPDKTHNFGIDNMVVCNGPPQFRGSYLNDVTVSDKICAPRIEPTFPLRMEIRQGDTMTLRCRALGVPIPEVYWVLPSGKLVHNNSEAMAEGFTLNQYGTLATAKVNDGKFTCIASNLKGIASREAWVKSAETSSTNIPQDPTTASTKLVPTASKDTSRTPDEFTSKAQLMKNYTTKGTQFYTPLSTAMDKRILTTSPTQLEKKIKNSLLLPTGKTETQTNRNVKLPLPKIKILNVLTTSALVTWTYYERVIDIKTLEKVEMKITLQHHNEIIYNDHVQPFGIVPEWELQTPEYNISLLEPDQTYKICLIVKCCKKVTEKHSCADMHTQKVIPVQKQNLPLVISMIISVAVLLIGGCFIVFYGKTCSFTLHALTGKSGQYQYLGLNKQTDQKHNIPMSELYPPLMDDLAGEAEKAKPTDCLIDTQSSVVYT